MYIENLLIHELAERAKTTVRTIRYYTDEGLLPQPIMQGKYAYYTPNHIQRLELIQRLKNSYLPLKEIRQIMLSLSDEEVKQRLQEQINTQSRGQVNDNQAHPEQGSGAKALEYISHLLDEQSVHRPKMSSTPPLPAHTRQASGTAPVLAPQPPTDAKITSGGETWQHIQLAEGVELNLRLPANPDTNIRAQQLIAFAKKIFS
ncbi:MAG: MerR family transcriptional regulator [Chloroflexota bacterium]